MNGYLSVISILLDDDDVTDIVSTRIYPGDAPQKAVYPLICVDTIDGEPFDTKSGISVLDHDIVKVICYATTDAESMELATAVRAALDGTTGTWNGRYIENIRFLRPNSYDINETNRRIRVHEHDYEVRVRLPIARAYGSIYNKTTFTSISDFTVRGVVTPTISSGKIAFTGGAGVYTNGINLTSPYNMLESFTMEAVVQWVSGSNGFGIGIHSQNTPGPHSVMGFFSGGSYGIACGSPFSNHDLQSLTTNSNDQVRMTLTKSGRIYTLTIVNLTAGGTVSPSFTFSLASTAEPVMDNTSQFSIWTLGDNFNVISLSISTTENIYSELCIMGDSISQGYEASIYANGFAQLLKADFPSLLLLAGQSDRTAEAVLRLPQLLAMAPRKLIMEIGVNDITGGVLTATWQANYASIVSQCEAVGIDVYHLKPYSTAVDLSVLQTFISTNYSSKIIDPHTSGAGNFASNGLHYNDTGNAAVYAAIGAAI